MIQKKKIIDLQEIFREKNPRLAKLIPPFILNYIRKVIHEKEVNKFIAAHGDEKDFDFVASIINEFNLTLHIIGKENIPLTGGCIFASNHPLGGLDAMTLLNEIGKLRKNLRFIVNDILLNLENLKSLFVPVNKHGKNSYEMLEVIDKLFASEYGVIIFPAGLVSRKQSGKIIDLEWKKSFITKARRYKRDVIPVFVDGRVSNRFYNIANIRKFFGIKSNIEMFYLVDELYAQKNKTITLIFGKPISHTLFTRKYSDLGWAQKVKKHVYALKSNNDASLIE